MSPFPIWHADINAYLVGQIFFYNPVNSCQTYFFLLFCRLLSQTEGCGEEGSVSCWATSSWCSRVSTAQSRSVWLSSRWPSYSDTTWCVALLQPFTTFIFSPDHTSLQWLHRMEDPSVTPVNIKYYYWIHFSNIRFCFKWEVYREQSLLSEIVRMVQTVHINNVHYK